MYLFLGSIGTIVETSELQLLAFNLAFEEYGISWKWDLKEYQEMLLQAGGQDRLKRYAASHKTNLDDESLKALHGSKLIISKNYCNLILCSRVRVS